MRRHRTTVVATAAAICLWAVAAAAQTVSVRSGEHDGFTRLVLDIPSGTDWTTETTSGGHRIGLNGVAGFDLGAAFDRIERNRIAALSGGPDGLDIAVACLCHVEAFLYRPDMLVVDVIDGPSPTQITEVAAEPTPATPPARVALPLFSAPVLTALPLTRTFDAPEPRSDALVATERAILESFARAASQGIFDFPSFPAAQGAAGLDLPAGIGLTPVTDPMDGVALPQSGTGPARPGLLVRTGIFRGNGGGPVDAAEPGTCTRLGRLDTAAWIDADAPFYEQIGPGRFDMTSETGRVVPQGVVDQARRYVAFGFGREALDVLGLLGGNVPAEMRDDVRTLRTLATIVDGATAPDTAVARGIGCGPDAAVWASLARGTLDGTDDAHRDAALVGLRDLPEALRGHLGLRLAALYSQAGEHLIASEILTAARHEVTGDGRAADLAQADLAGAELGPEAEIARLDTLAARDPQLPPETLVRLLDLTVEAGRAIDPSILELASSVRHDVGGEEVEAELARAEARATILAGDFDDALALIEETSELIGDETAGILRDAAIAASAERAGDGAFLDTALAMAPEDISASVQNAVAARLLALGFPDLAQSYLRGGAEQEAMRVRRYLRAEVAAALGDVTGADRALEGMTDGRAQEIRARARTASGDFAGAYAARDLAAATPEGEGAAWRAGDWTGLETSGDALLSDASRAILSAPPPPGDGTPLADRQALLAEAESTRALTEALLERFTVTADEGG